MSSGWTSKQHPQGKPTLCDAARNKHDLSWMVEWPLQAQSAAAGYGK